MTDATTEREALGRVIRDGGISGVTSDHVGVFDLHRADVVLASDWLAEYIATRVAETLRDLASEWDVVWNRGHDNSVHPYSHLLREAAQRYTWDAEQSDG